MSGVYIKGLKMPEKCLDCKLCAFIPIGDYGLMTKCLPLDRATDAEKLRTDCPLVAVPDHGDLIDRDELIENSGMCVCDFGTPDEQWRPDRDWYLTINAQTIIIPAERSESDEA